LGPQHRQGCSSPSRFRPFACELGGGQALTQRPGAPWSRESQRFSLGWCSGASPHTVLASHTHTVESEVSKVMGKAKRGRLHIKDILEAKRKIAKRKCFTMYHGNWHLRALLLSSMHQNNFKVQVKWGLLCTRARKSQKKAPKQFQARQTRNARNENEPGSKAHKLHNRCPGSTSSLSKSLAL
jgi:hypothetical protein